MKIQKIIVFILLLIVSKSFLYGQENELFVGSAADSIHKKKTNKTVEIIGIALPSVMITYGLISLGDNKIRDIDFDVRNSLEQNNRFWHTKVDDYIQYAPTVAAYSMKLCKVESTHNFLDMTILYGLSNLLTAGIVQGTKVVVGRERPSGSSLSFPSGHTGTAFVAAEFLYQEYKDKSIWISVGGYSVAAFVGVARIYNNKHWVSDVVAGAGIGILSTKVVYWAYPYFQKKFGKKDQEFHTLILPGYSNGNPSLAISYTF